MFTSLIDQEKITSQRSNRTGSIVRFIWHHQAGTNDDATIGMMVSGSRQVSSTYTVSNDNPGNRGYSRITGVVPEESRPWTSSSATADGRALTAEVANSSGGPMWGIADTTHEACARLAAYAYQKYGVPLKRATKNDPTGHLGHNEVLGMFGEGYATACPGNLNIDHIIARARQLVTGISGGALGEEDDMYDQAARDEVVGRIDNGFYSVGLTLQNFSDRIYALQFAAQEDQPFRLYRDNDANSPTHGAVVLLAPGIDWHVPTTDYVSLLQHYRLAGAIIGVDGDGSGNVFGFIRSVYSWLKASASNQDIIDALNGLDLSGVPALPPVVDADALSKEITEKVAQGITDRLKD